VEEGMNDKDRNCRRHIPDGSVAVHINAVIVIRVAGFTTGCREHGASTFVGDTETVQFF